MLIMEPDWPNLEILNLLFVYWYWNMKRATFLFEIPSDFLPRLGFFCWREEVLRVEMWLIIEWYNIEGILNQPLFILSQELEFYDFDCPHKYQTNGQFHLYETSGKSNSGTVIRE